MNGSGRFAGKGVLITGASRGLGSAFAEAFGSEGAHVGIAYRAQEGQARETLARVEDRGGSGEVLRVDVRDPESVRELVSRFRGSATLDVLVNNAAAVLDQPFLMLTPAEWCTVIDTNLTGTYHCCRAALPTMMSQRSGVIVNVASVAGLRAAPGQAAYGASKAGVLGLTRTLAAEAAPHGIRVNAVVPGFVNAGMGARMDRRVAEARTAAIPLGRFGEADEVAEATLFLASDAARYVVGQSLTVDGGLSL